MKWILLHWLRPVFTIALSLFITVKMDRLQKSFAVLCLAVFVSGAAAFLKEILDAGFWKHLEHLGLLAIAPAVVFPDANPQSI